ncbi:MAG: MinD/ParA family protein [Desulfobacteraceae bacterium]|jgi:flagellar biosynthesis protein FlhG
MKKKDQSHNVIDLKKHMMSKSNEKNGHRRDNRQKRPKIIAITSGKGGVGKTNIVANLGFTLSRLGKKVLILDADLGLGNLDVLLGLTPEYNLSHVLRGEKQISEIVVPGPGRMQILPAASGIQELTSLSAQDRQVVFGQLESFIRNFDIMFIDTAAGISSNVLYFNINADEIIVVATPEPTSITDAYALMKVLSVKYGTDQFKLIVNAAASDGEADDVFRQLNLVADRFLDVTIDYYGGVVLDDNLKKGVRQQKMVSELAPLTKASRNFANLARKIAKAEFNSERKGHFRWGMMDIPS